MTFSPIWRPTRGNAGARHSVRATVIWATDLSAARGSGKSRKFFQIGDEVFHLRVTGGFVWGTENRRRVHRGHDERRVRGFHQFAATPGDAKLWPEERLRGSRSQANNHL